MKIGTVMKKYGYPKTTKCVCGKRAYPREFSVHKTRGKFIPAGEVQYSCNNGDCDSNTGGDRITYFHDGRRALLGRFPEYED
jgi:hypothetical protein